MCSSRARILTEHAADRTGHAPVWGCWWWLVRAPRPVSPACTGCHACHCCRPDRGETSHGTGTSRHCWPAQPGLPRSLSRRPWSVVITTWSLMMTSRCHDDVTPSIVSAASSCSRRPAPRQILGSRLNQGRLSKKVTNYLLITYLLTFIQIVSSRLNQARAASLALGRSGSISRKPVRLAPPWRKLENSNSSIAFRSKPAAGYSYSYSSYYYFLPPVVKIPGG